MKLNKKYKVKLSKKAKKSLKEQAELCRQLWNHALEQRILAYKLRTITLNVYDQKKELPELKEEFPEFKKVYNKYLAAVLFRLQKAFNNFFRRVKNGETPGFPRFKSRKRFFSLETPGDYCQRIDDYTLKLPQGIIVKVSAKLPENIGTVVLKKTSRGWFITIVADVAEGKKDKPAQLLAFDLGIKTLAVGFNGKVFKVFNSLKQIRYFDKIVDKLKSKRSKTKKNSRRYKSYTKAIRRICQKITNKRRNHFHHVSKWIMTQEAENAIVVGDLQVREMLEVGNKKKNREIQNRWAIREFIAMCEYKAKLYGKHIQIVSERNTTKRCSNCKSLKKMKLNDRVYKCNKCGFKMDRDKNSSINIYNESLSLFGL